MREIGKTENWKGKQQRKKDNGIRNKQKTNMENVATQGEGKKYR